MKRADSFLDEQSLTQGTKLNLVFYLAMYATCNALKSVKPQRTRIASLDISLLTDSVLRDCYDWLLKRFMDLGGDDKVSKGPSLTASLKTQIVEQYGKKKSA